MKRLFSILTFSLTSMAMYSQVVLKGVVKDETGKPIAGVNVSTESDSLITKTDQAGLFLLNLKSVDHEVSFSTEKFITVRKKIDKLDDPQNMVIIMKREDVKQIAEVFLTADRRLQVNRLNIKNLENPMTVNILSHDMLEQLDINNIEDAAKNITGVYSINTYGGFQFFNIRGFENFVVLYDGIRDERHNITQSAPIANFANVERIEVLKGPSGDMFGHSALGAILNIIRKKPTSTLQGNAKFTFGSYKTFGATVGVGGPVTDKLRYRFDFGTTNTDGWKDVEEKTNNMSAVVEYLPTSKDTFEFMFQYNKDDYGADTGVPAYDNGKPYEWLNPKTNFADPTDYIKNEKKEYSLRYTHKFNSSTVLRNVFSYFDDSIDYLMDEVIFTNEAKKTFARFNGAYHFNHVTRPIVNQADLTFKFNTGKITHKSIVGGSFTYLDRKSYYGNVGTDLNDLGKDISIYSLVGNVIPKTLTDPKAAKASVEETVVGLYFQDWISISERLKFLVGLRYDIFSGDYKSKSKPDIISDDFNNFTYRGAISYEPVKNFMTVYASASKFFKPSRTHHSSKTDAMFEPEKGFQVESGIKLEKKNLLNLTLSGYYIEKNHFTVGHTSQSQVGKATSRGFEIDGDVKIVEGLYLKAGYSFTDAYFAKQDDPAISYLKGNPTPWTPKHLLNTWLNYEFTNSELKGLGIGLGAYYTAKTYQNELHQQYLPAYTLLNASIYYRAKNNIRIGLNIENLADTLYYNSSLSSNDLYPPDFIPGSSQDYIDKGYKQSTFQIYPGRGRNYKLSISYEF